MIYILDTNIFSDILKHLTPINVFEKIIYEPLKQLIKEERLISVDEVYEELSKVFSSKEEPWGWIKANKKIFQYLSNDECNNLMEIYKNKKFREGVKERSIRMGSPEADAMLVAKAMSKQAIVVTTEANNKPNSEKLPNICVAFNVKYMKKSDFYQVLKNISEEKKELENVKIWDKLEVDNKSDEK